MKGSESLKGSGLNKSDSEGSEDNKCCLKSPESSKRPWKALSQRSEIANVKLNDFKSVKTLVPGSTALKTLIA